MEDNSEAWESNEENKQSLLFQFPTPVTVDGLRIKKPSRYDQTAPFTKYNIKSSRDGDSWTTVKAGNWNEQSCCDWESIEFPVVTSHNIRLELENPGGNIAITHLQLRFDSETRCLDEVDMVNVPLATVTKLDAQQEHVPCNTDWNNNQMLMSDRSCVRFTAASDGPIYFALSAVPKRNETWYYY